MVNFQRGNRTMHTVRLNQRFFGHDALNNLRMDTYLEGDLPDISVGAKVTIDDYNENYKRIGPGLSTKSFIVLSLSFSISGSFIGCSFVFFFGN